MERQFPSGALPEREMLLSWLEFQRATFATKLDGLDDAAAARRSTPPSTMSLLGLVRHHTDGELALFPGCIAGEPVDHLWLAEGADFDELDEPLGQAIARWRAACDRSREICDRFTDLDAMCAAPLIPDQPVSVRWMLVHAIEEYARHNGHADLLRQAIDGSTGY